MDTISIGKHNPRLADIRKAIQRDTLTADGLLVIEGPTLVREAEASGAAITTLFLRDGTSAEGLPRASTVYSIDAATFKSIQATERSQGVIALVRPRIWTLNQILTGIRSTVVVLAGLQDPGNVGTILRVAESFGAAGCLALVGTAAIHNSKVTRASAGSVFRLPHVWNLDLQTVVAEFKTAGVPIVGTSPHSSQSIAAWDWNQPVGVLIGNEGAGLSREQSGACAAMLRIPHEPETESLNSAIAAAVILYEAYRRRHLP